MNRFRGLQVQSGSNVYVLKELLSEGGFSFIYTTNFPQMLCKIQVISMQQILETYNYEKYLLTTLQHKNIIRLYEAIEIVSKGDRLGLLLIQYCPRGNLLSLLDRSKQQNIDEKIVLRVFLNVLSALELLHVNGVSHRDIKLENILEGADGEFKICDFGSATGQTISAATNENRHLVEEDIEKHTTPLYRSPEQLDLYSGFEIGTKVDVFALGCAMFMLCFKKQPFESRLSSINTQFFLPEATPYSQFLLGLIKRCFTPNPKFRPSSSELVQQILEYCRMQKTVTVFGESLSIEEEYKSTMLRLSTVELPPREDTTTPVKCNVMEKIRRLFHQMYTETEGWIMGFIEESEEAPLVKYNRFIISKCWEKRYKVEKVYQIIDQETIKNIMKSVVILKILILVHNFLRKGPSEAISNTYKINSTTICMKIYKSWKTFSKTDRSVDRKRNPFICLLIEMYSVILIEKTRLGFTYAFFIEGNFSLLPFFKMGATSRVLSLSFIEELLSYLEKVISFHERVQSASCIIDIQRSIILSLVDEEYCLISLLVHLYIAFKEATNYMEEEIDEVALKAKICQTDSKFENAIIRLSRLFEAASKFSTLFSDNKFEINPQIIEYIRRVQILKRRKNFNLKKFLNYNITHCGLKLPLTYEEVIKNPAFLKDLIREGTAENFNGDGSVYLQIDNFKKKQSHVSEIITTSNRVPVMAPGPPTQNNTKNVDKDFDFFEDLKPEIEAQNRGPVVVAPFKSFTPNIELMEFTHQNLNKDYRQNQILLPRPQFQPAPPTTPQPPPVVHDKFKQFLSLASSNPSGLDESIQAVEPLDFSAFQDAPPQDPQPPKSPKPQQPAPKADSYMQLDLKFFIVGQVTKNANQYIINFNELQFSKIVGNGHSSEVYLGRWRGQEVAIKKILDKRNNHQFKRQIMTSLKMRPHSNLVTLIGVAENQGSLYIISEYCHGGTLFHLLHQSKGVLSWASRVDIAKQIAQGMLFLHMNNPPIVHRDLKSLKTLADRLQLKIADFGLSREMSLDVMTGILGTFHWMAPQIFNNQKYTYKADIYSYGIVLWQIMSRQTPYKNMDSPQALMKYVTLQDGRPDLKVIPPDCPGAFKALMMKCWDQDPSKRPDFTTILSMLSQIAV